MRTRRLARIAALVATFTILASAACPSLRDAAVPGCPYCGDPVTMDGPDGRAHVVPRMRLHGDGAAAIEAALAATGGGPWTVRREEPAPAR